MPPTWTTPQVEALAPDPSSAKSGRELANPRKWKTLGHADEAAWGECQGSGKDPYQTQVDLSGPAFRCSCPSRKFPCKHGLGLLHLLAAQPDALTETEPPAWVTEWLAGRAKRAETRTEQQAKKAEPGAAPADPAARAKRTAQRLSRVTAGIDYVDTWLRDLVRGGLAGVAGQHGAFWETPAARMLDAQAPGVARMIRDMAAVAATGEGWQERLLEHLGRLHLLLEGFRRVDSLPPENQADLRALIGWTLTQEELLAGCPEGAGTWEEWVVVGQRVEEEDRLRVQRTWLWGRQTGMAALILVFAAYGQTLETSLTPGTSLTAELVYYPSAWPQRALVRAKEPAAAAVPEGLPTVAAAVERYAGALSRQPWLERFPFLLRSVTPAHHDGRWRVRDGEGGVLPVAPGFSAGWKLLALSGGSPVTLFGEWDGDHLTPLSLWRGAEFHPLISAGPA